MKLMNGVLALLVAAQAPVVRADGMLDPFFGNGGLVTTTFPNHSPAVAWTLLGTVSGSRTCVGGAASAGVSLAHMAVACYDWAGELVPSFGVGGRVLVTFQPVRNSIVRQILPQPEDRLLLVGQVDGGVVALVRLNADGTEDGTFGTKGRVETTVADAGNLLAAALQADGRILVFLSVGAGTDRQPLVMRYRPDGTLDPTFGTGGRATIPVPTFLLALRGGLAVQPDGHILVAGSRGSVNPPLPSEPLIVRLRPDGSLDPSFAVGGVLVPDWGGSDVAVDVRVQPDGRVVVAGNRFLGTVDLVLARYLSDGTPDRTFGAGGIVVTDAGGTERPSQLVVLENGKLLVVGNGGNDFLSVRYNPDGTLDTTFGLSGFLRTSFTSTSLDEPSAVGLVGPGRFTLAGRTRLAGEDVFAVARYLAVVPVELLRFTVE